MHLGLEFVHFKINIRLSTYWSKCNKSVSENIIIFFFLLHQNINIIEINYTLKFLI